MNDQLWFLVELLANLLLMLGGVALTRRKGVGHDGKPRGAN